MALTAATTPRTGAPTAAEIRTDTTAAVGNAAAPAGQWTNSMVTDAIPGQVVGFTLPDKCRLDAILTTAGTDFATNADTPLLEERGSFQGAVTTGSPAAISFMVPVNAVHGVSST